MHLSEYPRIYIDVRSHLTVCKSYTRGPGYAGLRLLLYIQRVTCTAESASVSDSLILSGCWHACCIHRYFTITGQKADENTIEQIIETGESEKFLQKAIHEQGRGQILESIREIQERHDAVKEIERNLLELHQIFMDMAVLVEAQGEQLNDIESQVF